jgi:hypothetical protein
MGVYPRLGNSRSVERLQHSSLEGLLVVAVLNEQHIAGRITALSLASPDVIGLPLSCVVNCIEELRGREKSIWKNAVCIFSTLEADRISAIICFQRRQSSC